MPTKRLRLLLAGIVIVAVVPAICGRAWTKGEERLAQHRDILYQATLHSYTDALKPGLTRKDVESYLRANNKVFSQMCCMERSDKNAYDDLTPIGKEGHPWFCSAHNVYIGFEFVSAGTHRFPEAHDSDTLTNVRVFHWLEGCL